MKIQKRIKYIQNEDKKKKLLKNKIKIKRQYIGIGLFLVSVHLYLQHLTITCSVWLLAVRHWVNF